MSQNENGNVATPDTGSALVAAQSTPQALAAASLQGPGFGQPIGAGGTDVLKGSMDRSGLFHALRRRWGSASFLGLLLGTLAAFGLYWLFPETNSATAQYQVSSSPLTLLDKNSTTQTKEFDVYKSTQVAYLKSPMVLMAALGADGAKISRFEMFKGIDEAERVEWLRDQLQVSFPSRGELLEISMAGPYDKNNLKAVVEAVCQAYQDTVLFQEDIGRQLPLKLLRDGFQTISKQVEEKLQTYQSLAKDSGSSAQYEGIDPETKMMLSEVQALHRRKTIVQASLTDATTQFKVFEAQINDPSWQEQQVAAQVQSDPNLNAMMQEMMYYQMQIRNLRATYKRGTSPQIRSIQKQMQQLSQEIEQMKQQMQSQIAGESSTEPNPILKTQTTTYQIMRQSMQMELSQLNKGLEDLKQKLLLKAENNTDLMLKLAEIEQLREVQQAIAVRIQNLQVEAQAPNRVKAIGATPRGGAKADTFENRNRLQRYGISAIGGLGTFGLTCLAIGFVEFTRRRLNSPEQVEEGLGIRVIGTLPKLSNKAAVRAQINESIDSVRTALMHESTKKKRQLVLVTSADTSEGRTTVAGQLAASLARAGRRTLLIDGDLRRPVLHKLFDMPLEDGLCEVLRTEAETADVVRATHTEGLWLMTAGYCDVDAVKALATDQVQPIFEKLRADYDFIIIDGAPVIGLSDSLLFGQHCDGAILSVLRDRSCVTNIHRSVELLGSVGVRIIGSVVNGVKAKTDRRVTHLQSVTPKREQKKLASVGAAADEPVSDDIDFDLES